MKNKNCLLTELLLVITCLLFLPGVSNAQLQMAKIEGRVPPDPDADKITKYGNYDLNLSTGQVDVTVPLFDLLSDTSHYKVALKYDHLGIPVDSRATNIGMNWILSPGGVITRTVMGLPDEWGDKGYNNNYHWITDSTLPPQLYHPTGFNDMYYLVALGRADFQPDIYSYSFNGRSGKFYYNPSTGSFYTMPYSKLLIKKVTVGGEGDYFEIIDEMGYQYLFNIKSKTDIEQLTQDGQSDYSAIYDGQWYLTQIKSPSGSIIYDFEYVSEAVSIDVERIENSRNYLMSASANPPSDMGNQQYCSDYLSPYLTLENASLLTTQISYRGLLVSKIKSPFQTLRFTYSARLDEGKKLDSMILQKNDNSIIKSWVFYHSYYATGNKLKLDSLNLFNGVQKVNGYKFEYNPGAIPAIGTKAVDHWGFPNNLTGTSLFPKIWYNNQYIGDVSKEPNLDYTKRGILSKISYPTGGSTEFEYELNDYGRVGNGGLANEPIYSNHSQTLTRRTTQSGTGTSVSSFTINSTSVAHFATRRDNCDGNPPASGNCSIEPCQTQIQLIYPDNSIVSLNGQVGIETPFDISLNPGTYTLKVTTNELLDYGRVILSYRLLDGYDHAPKAGGLRIKSIKNTDQYSGSVNTRHFVYRDADDTTRSSGYVPRLPSYTYYNHQKTICISSNVCNMQRNYVVLTERCINNIFYSEDNPVSYSRVVEYIGTNGEGGHIDHRFSYQNDNQDQAFPNPPASPYFWKRGLPVQTLYYNNTSQLVKEELNEYTFEPTLNYNTIKGASFGFSNYSSCSPSESELSSAFTDYISQWGHLDKKTLKNYPDGSSTPIIEETQYYYDNPASIQVTRTRTTESDGSMKQERTTYAQDYNPVNNSDVMEHALYKMIQKNMIACPIEKTESIINGSQELITSSTLNTFKEFTTDKVLPWQFWQLTIPAPLSYISLSGTTNNAFVKNSAYTNVYEMLSYNANGQITEMKDQTNNNYTIKYGYGGLLPECYVKNALNNQVYYNNFEELTTNYSSTSKYGTKGYSGILTIPAGNLVAGSYDMSWWSYSGGAWTYHEQALSHNGTTNIMIGNTGGIIDEVIIIPANGWFNSINYMPGIGVSAKVHESGTGLKFEYDNIGRLQYIKDQNGNIIKNFSYQFQGAQ